LEVSSLFMTSCLYTFWLGYFNLFLQCAWSSPHFAGFPRSPQVFSVLFPNFSQTVPKVFPFFSQFSTFFQHSYHVFVAFLPHFPAISGSPFKLRAAPCALGYPQLQGQPAGGCWGDPGVHPGPLAAPGGTWWHNGPVQKRNITIGPLGYPLLI